MYNELRLFHSEGVKTKCEINGVNFINILRTAFTVADISKVQKVQSKCFFALLGSEGVKAAHKSW